VRDGLCAFGKSLPGQVLGGNDREGRAAAERQRNRGSDGQASRAIREDTRERQDTS
jgi:hypothetical protein